MTAMPINILTKETFLDYGTVIEKTPNHINGWDIVISEKSAGWRIGVFEFARRKTTAMERHPDSLETFEPVHGVSVIIVASGETPENFSAFLLDKPVCLHKGVWHEVIALSETVTVKITENDEVKTEHYRFKKEISASIIEN